MAGKQRRRWTATIIGAVAVIALVVIAAVSGSHHSHATATVTHADAATATLTGPAGGEGIPLEEGTVLAPITGAASGATVDGVQCNSSEQLAYHIHTHVTIYVNGTLRPVPAGIGLVETGTKCDYWLHTHVQDGVIHVEAPSSASFTLGQFFAVWNQPLNSSLVGPASGAVTAYVDGKLFTGDPASIALGSREDIQLDVGTQGPPPQKVDWSQSQL